MDISVELQRAAAATAAGVTMLSAAKEPGALRIGFGSGLGFRRIAAAVSIAVAIAINHS